jgi:arsenite-transporting ATPase
MDQEVVGLDSLRNLASHIYGEDDPSRVYCEGLSQQIVTTNGKRILNIKLPFTSKEDLDVIENNDELTIQVGQYRRNIFLPRALAGLGVDEARMDGDNLIIVFGSGAS